MQARNTYWVVCSTPHALSPDALSSYTLSPGALSPRALSIDGLSESVLHGNKLRRKSSLLDI